MLSTRRFTYGSVRATETMRQALSAHLAWGAFPTPGYTALRKSLQARVLSVAAPVIEKASRVHVTLAVGKKAPYTVSIAHFASVESSPALAAAAAGHGEADEEAPAATDAAGVTVAEKRLRKKAGDLVMLFFTWLDWDHSTAHVGGSDAGLSGAFADFREDLREALCAFAKGLLFEPNAFAAADAAPAAELLHQLRVLAAALYSYLLWRSDTPQIGWHPVAETRQYEKFAAALLDELSAEWAAPSAGDAIFSALPLLDTFAEMREREDACSEEVVRAVTSCARSSSSGATPPPAAPPPPRTAKA